MIEPTPSYTRPGIRLAHVLATAGLALFTITGILWWQDIHQQRIRVNRLTLENKKLAEQNRHLQWQLSRIVSDRKAVAGEPEGKVSTDSSPASKMASPKAELEAEPASYIDVESFVAAVHEAENESELDEWDFAARNVADAVPRLWPLTRRIETGQVALYALRRIPIERFDSAILVRELLNVIETFRLCEDPRCEGINQHAYSMLIAAGEKALPAVGKVREIMLSDDSPWAAYACVTVAYLSPDPSVAQRLVALLDSRFPSNRLIAARKMTEFYPAADADTALHKALAREKSPAIRTSLENALRRLQGAHTAGQDRTAESDSGDRR